MPRIALRTLAVAALLVLPTSGTLRGAATGALDPHMDHTLVPAGCTACHGGHGASRSPMLESPQSVVCLSCHGHAGDFNRAVAEGVVSATAQPALIGSALSQPYRHPLTAHAFSRHEPRVVTCTSCHSPHRGSRDPAALAEDRGQRRRSHRDPNRFEYEVCQDCHGHRGSTSGSLTDVSRLFNPGNRSYHPVEAPARDTSSSVVSSLAGREINCTDCHANSDPAGPRGPHGSAEPFILSAPYATVDGSADPRSAYRLCFTCHDLQAVLHGTDFEGHGRHITEIRASCATCHNAHGSVRNRALIRFGEETVVAGAAPSVASGRLAFVSRSPGSGACFLSCHGRDHAPETYGLMAPTTGLTQP